MKNQGSVEDFIERLKTRYTRDNPVLDLLLLIEMLREENQLFRHEIIAPTPPDKDEHL